MSESFDKALAFLLRPDVEGGLVDHPADPGGRTNMGVTQRKLDEVRAAHPERNLPATVDQLNHDQVGWIYRIEYWDRLHLDELPPKLALVVMNAGVNAGIGRAARWLQQALRVKADGVIGAQTIAAARAASEIAIVNEFCARLAWHYMTLDSIDDVFGLGWSRRLMLVHSVALGAEP